MTTGKAMNEADDPCLQNRGTVEKIGPGVYVCPEKHIHFFAVEICEELGIEPTPHNLDIVTEQSRKVATEFFPETPQEVKE